MNSVREIALLCAFTFFSFALFAPRAAHTQTASILGPATTQVVAGEAHTCALTTAGAVECWGSNNKGQLGDGSTTEHHTPVTVSSLSSGVLAIAAGQAHTCALTAAGAVKCWGHNISGELGDASTTDRHAPVAVVGLDSGVAAIAAGRVHTCALTNEGAVECWGYNNYGELGDGTSSNARNEPVAVTGLSAGVVAITAGDYHTCALTTAGAVKCWGRNTSGQLGDSSTSDSPVPVAVGGLGGVAMIAAGGAETCALTNAGAVKCWGSNSSGQLGDTTLIDSPVPVAVSGLASGALAITVGEQHSCALAAASAAKCWGSNSDGQLGDTTTTDSAVPVAVSGLASGVAAIATGDNHTCALNSAGAVKCWGSNGNGELGNDSTMNSPVPVGAGAMDSEVTMIAAGQYHSCAVTTSGAAECWGNNDYGQLGDGDHGQAGESHVPVAVSGLGSGVAAIVAGDLHTCALTTAGAVMCWGRNNYGQLGDNTTSDRYTAVAVFNLDHGVAAIAAGGNYTCALTSGGAVKCWGSNSRGQLGDGTETDQDLPVAVSGIPSGALAITASDDHTCAVTATGVKCWGRNNYGQLGNDTATSSDVPVDVLNLGDDVMAIAAGTLHTCAVTPTGAAMCWGYNSDGQLGSNLYNESHVPVAVRGLDSNVAAITAGQFHTCALTTAGAVRCWGRNNRGQLGNNTTTQSHVPVDAHGLASGIASIAAGDNFTCALTATGLLKCWGDNGNGQFGDDTTTDRLVPVNIRAGQSTSFNPPMSLDLTAEFVDLDATATSGRTVTFDTWTPDTCGVIGHSLMILHAAQALCGIRASQAGGTRPLGGSDAPAPQQLRLIRISDVIFADGFDD